MKCSLGISSFLKEISIRFRSILFPLFLSLVHIRRLFLKSVLAFLWNSAFSLVYLSLPPFPFVLPFSCMKSLLRQPPCLLEFLFIVFFFFFSKKIFFCFIDYAEAFDNVHHNKLWNILKEMGIPDHITCVLRNLYAGQEAPVRTGHGRMDWFKIGEGVCQGCILSPCLFNLYPDYII